MHFAVLCVPREENAVLSKPEPVFVGIPEQGRMRDEGEAKGPNRVVTDLYFEGGCGDTSAVWSSCARFA